MLRVESVSVKRGRTLTLKDISLSLSPGKTLAVVGESGAGKSTLIAAILGFLRPWRGEISWAGAPVRDCAPSLVMQEPRAAFNPTLTLRRSVMEPVSARRSPPSLDRIDRLCRGLELTHALLDRRPAEVSIGQAQRLGLLRALIAAPPLVLFDEPLSALDSFTRKRTARLIADLQAEEGFAALVVTHDLGYACAYADDIAVLRSGRIEELRAPKEFIASPRTGYGRTLRDAAIALCALERAS